MTRTILRAVASLLLTNAALACVPQRPPSGDPNGPYGKPMPEDTHDENLRKAIQEQSNQIPGQSPRR
jgi:hypothetical protein